MMQSPGLFSLDDLVLVAMKEADGLHDARTLKLQLGGCGDEECTFLCRCPQLLGAERERDWKRAFEGLRDRPRLKNLAKQRR